MAAQEYTFLAPVPHTTNYYRLRQVDDNGWASYSSVISLRNDGGPLVYRAYPNPARNILHLAIPVRQAGLTTAVYGVPGNLVQTRVFEPPRDGVDLDVSGLRTGMYFLRIIQADGESETLPFLKE